MPNDPKSWLERILDVLPHFQGLVATYAGVCPPYVAVDDPHRKVPLDDSFDVSIEGVWESDTRR
ncbi:hypothetical protein JGU71_04260 [Antrihabitans sp. YC3-6]|uniref:Uncharacterized protein n=1 Tax=Antrihabitans stalagmiti TaxID=2799499 RepID=A0A934NMS2_9NOCA|nr:hypothetical protein [Antrihabitans stalagmiti]MBJ8338091.1 hypothetical protein [Antrihabitans stalagmiti]